MTTNVPAPVFGDRGFVIPSQQAVLAGVVADIQFAFGGKLNLDASDPNTLSTPQGQLATSWAAIINSVYQTFLYQSTQTDPAYARGRWQDAIGRIYFLSRVGAEPTVVQGLCNGLQGTVLTAGVATARAEDGNLYVLTQDGVIPESGTITLPFACAVPGPIPCAEGTMNEIYRAVPGWDSVTNPEAGAIGNDTENRAAFEARRALSVAKNSMGMLPSVSGALAQIDGVLDVFAYENDTSGSITYRGVSIAKNSIYVAVVGGTDDDVAKTIWTKKMPGCGYTGNTTVTVYDDSAQYQTPYPSYSVTFQRPDSLPVLFSVEIANNASVPADAADQIKAAIIAAFAGADGGPRAQIASSIYASRYYAPVAALGAWAQIIEIQIGSENTAAAKFTAGISATDMTVSAVASGALAPGQTVVAPGVADGTVIVSQSSGTTGSTGVYVVSRSQTVGSRAMAGALPDQNVVSVDADQVPTISTDNIAVVVTLSGPPYPPPPESGSNAIGRFIIGVSPIGSIKSFDDWKTVISQYANSPILTALIRDFDDSVDQTKDFDDLFSLIWNIDTAENYGLDVWGRIVGVTRTLQVASVTYFDFEESGILADSFGPGGQSPFYAGVPSTSNYRLSDAAYRTLIFAKALANITDGSIKSINTILMNLFGSADRVCYVVDNADMTMTYKFQFVLSPVQVAIVEQFGVLPRPTGVSASVEQA